MKTSLNNPCSQSQKQPSNYLIDFIMNDPETQMRIGIKESEEKVKNDTKYRKLTAPLSTEEKILLSQ
jgi:hypothetical protein